MQGRSGVGLLIIRPPSAHLEGLLLESQLCRRFSWLARRFALRPDPVFPRPSRTTGVCDV